MRSAIVFAVLGIVLGAGLVSAYVGKIRRDAAAATQARKQAEADALVEAIRSRPDPFEGTVEDSPEERAVMDRIVADVEGREDGKLREREALIESIKGRGLVERIAIYKQGAPHALVRRAFLDLPTDQQVAFLDAVYKNHWVYKGFDDAVVVCIDDGTKWGRVEGFYSPTRGFDRD